MSSAENFNIVLNVNYMGKIVSIIGTLVRLILTVIQQQTLRYKITLSISAVLFYNLYTDLTLCQ